AALEMRAACELDRGIPGYWEALATMEQMLGNAREASLAYQQACGLEPTTARRIQAATVVSPIPASIEGIMEERRRLDAMLDALLADVEPSPRDPDPSASWPGF